MNTPNDLPTPTVLHSKYRAAKQRIRELEEHNQQLLAGGQYLLKAEAEARKKVDILDYLLADVTNRLPDVLRNAGYIEFIRKEVKANERRSCNAKSR